MLQGKVLQYTKMKMKMLEEEDDAGGTTCAEKNQNAATTTTSCNKNTNQLDKEEKGGEVEAEAVVVLYYLYTCVPDPPGVVKEQRELCASLKLEHGRVRIAREGVNGTLAGPKHAVEAYCKAMDAHPVFGKGIDWKFSPCVGGKKGLDGVFADLFIAEVKELAAHGTIKPPAEGEGEEGGTTKKNPTKVRHVSPQEWHETLSEPERNLVLIDVRNFYETAIGRFTLGGKGKGKRVQQGGATDKKEGEADGEAEGEGERERERCDYSVDEKSKSMDSSEMVVVEAPEAGTSAPQVVDPKTRMFSEFPRWVERNKAGLEGKRVLMYCTGGIRCETAANMIAAHGVATEVCQLKGGIHRYIEAYPPTETKPVGNGTDSEGEGEPPSEEGNQKKNEHQNQSKARGDATSTGTGTSTSTGAHSLFIGRNFVFDGRQSLPSGDNTCVGRCALCSCPHERYAPGRCCTVCRDLVLVCDGCAGREERKAQERHAGNVAVYWCDRHKDLRNVYYSELRGFSQQDLEVQVKILENMHQQIKGRKSTQRNRRRTLSRQMQKIRQAMNENENDHVNHHSTSNAEDAQQRDRDHDHDLQEKKKKKQNPGVAEVPGPGPGHVTTTDRTNAKIGVGVGVGLNDCRWCRRPLVECRAEENDGRCWQLWWKG